MPVYRHGQKAPCLVGNVLEVDQTEGFTDDIEEVTMLARRGVGPTAGWSSRARDGQTSIVPSHCERRRRPSICRSGVRSRGSGGTPPRNYGRDRRASSCSGSRIQASMKKARRPGHERLLRGAPRRRRARCVDQYDLLGSDRRASRRAPRHRRLWSFRHRPPAFPRWWSWRHRLDLRRLTRRAKRLRQPTGIGKQRLGFRRHVALLEMGDAFGGTVPSASPTACRMRALVTRPRKVSTLGVQHAAMSSSTA